MKKVLSIILALVLVCSFSFSAMALKSSGGTEYHKVVINQTHTGSNADKAQTEVVVKGDTIDVKPVAPKQEGAKFDAIAFFKDAAAKVAAVLGVDFEIVSVKFNSNGTAAVEGVDYKVDKASGKVISLKGELLTVEVKPLADNLFISDSFKDANDKVIVEDIKFNGVKSDPTGDTYNTTVLAVLCLMIMGAGVVAFASKRSFN